MTDISSLTITELLDIAGTFAFAISGIRLASGKKFDWFGAYVVGLITAIGGGTTRDLLLGVQPFWMEESRYLIVTGVALLTVILFKSRPFKWGKTLFIFDAIGLGLFTVSGIEKSLDLGLPVWLCIMMGCITGSVGGVIRDIIINEIPLLFRKDLYALATIAGGAVYFLTLPLESVGFLREILTASTVIALRVIAVRYKLHLPQLGSDQKAKPGN